MRWIKGLALAVVCVTLSGCSLSGELENQAYVLAMGLDSASEEQLRVTIRVPSIGQTENGGNGAETEPYITFSTEGSDFTQALDALQRQVPRELNLGHILLITVSEELARNVDFKALANQLSETPHLYANAHLAVCPGSAGELISRQALTMGTRLSVEIAAALEHYELEGFIPRSTLADFCAVANSVYSNSFAAMVKSDADSPSGERLEGMAVFDEQGRLALTLDKDQTRLFCLIAGTGRNYIYSGPGSACHLIAVRRPKLRVEYADGTPRLKVSMSLSIQGANKPHDSQAMATVLAESVGDLIRVCQTHRLDPFGFGERAAARFLALDQWQAYNWESHYTAAPVDVSIEIK